MPNRTAKFVSAIFASILAGTPLTTTSHGATVAADGCVAGPKSPTPPGRHWYYRIEHPSNRHCWYLREENDKISQAAPQNASASENPPSPEADNAMQQSVANARAELPAQTYRNEVPNPVLPANAAGLNGIPRAIAPDTNAALSVVASRWPDPSGLSPASSSPLPAVGKLATNLQENTAAATPPAVAAVTFAAADSSSQNQLGQIPALLAAIAGALALAGIAASLLFKFGRASHPRSGAVRARRDPIRESTDDDRIALPDYRSAKVSPRRSRISRGSGEAGDPNKRIAEFYSRISGPAPT